MEILGISGTTARVFVVQLTAAEMETITGQSSSAVAAMRQGDKPALAEPEP